MCLLRKPEKIRHPGATSIHSAATWRCSSSCLRDTLSRGVSYMCVCYANLKKIRHSEPTSIHSAAQERMTTRRKRAPPPLHVSLHRIEEEKTKLAQRTRAKLETLLTETNQSVLGNASHCDIKHGDMRSSHYHGVLITLCFCLWLLTINLLCFQWLYIKVSARDQR